MTTSTKLNSFTGADYGEKATLTLPIGPTYEEIFLETNLTAAQLSRVTLTLNADEIIVLNGEFIKKLEAYKGLTQVDGFFTIPLADITAKTKNGVSYTGLVTEMGDNITLEVEIAATAQENAPKVQLQAWATVSARQPARVLVPKIKKQTMQASSTENEFLDLVSGPLQLIRRMHFLSGEIHTLQIYRDFVKVFDSSKGLEEMRAKRNRRFWQANCFHFDPIMRGFYIDELFPTAHSSELKFTVKTNQPEGSIPIIVESVEVVRPDLV
ncbi:putative major phage capsid protein [Vibrio crassostreae]|uniref:major capsid protein P2 n=1 Tax=Vibrio crassostreae TaxID=246167 RepID=UPI001B3101A6|nr:major capsid protein P2 [Vibrio crassostreae]CAK1818815.1 putative major phage capsid protein [Vibrio crassostreae]CAK1819145.1 putative major phage capsid protein [Vibrio crassostreae]CAK1878949.1 putative major phage capsid protein [Vibrio crassostreae]CAK1880799.1 putative major phage capsid protein [Vibrio crassostreae]CAK1895045.1 putative major phage capsid protein [Vibrio crassostreae]